MTDIDRGRVTSRLRAHWLVFRRAIAAILLFGLCASCVPSDIENRAQPVLVAVDSAIDNLAASVQNWNEVLEDLRNDLAQLDDKAATLARTEVQQLTERTIAATGTEFRCNVDFLGHRVMEGLQGIKARLLGKAETKTHPTLCGVSPSTIELALPPERRAHIEITGYNFDQAAYIVQLVAENGTRTEAAPENVTVQTHYKIVVVLDRVPLVDETRAVELAANGKVLTSVPVIKNPPPPKCEVRTVHSPTTSYTAAAVHTGEGDKDVLGKGEVHIRVFRGGDDSIITARIHFRVRQWDDDHSTGEITTPDFELFRADSTDQIVNVEAPAEEGPDDYRDTTWEPETIGGGGGLVGSYVVYAEGPREDLNGWARVTAYFNSFKISVVPRAGCEA